MLRLKIKHLLGLAYLKYNTEDLDIVMLVHNYCDNYSMTSGNLWNYYRDEIDNDNNNGSEGRSLRQV